MKLVIRLYLIAAFSLWLSMMIVDAQSAPRDFVDPPHEFSVMPFWLWNDTLKDEKIIRQIADFETHGVFGFVIHPRIGLPDNIKWLSPEMIHSMRTAITEAVRRNMHVILYDDGMYPSGSSGGQVVARNPAYAARGLAKICYQHQRDFNYLEMRYLWEGAKIDSNGIQIAGMNYGILIIDSLSDLPDKAKPSLKILAANGRLIINKYSDYSSLFNGTIIYESYESLLAVINHRITVNVSMATPCEDIRYRHVIKGNEHLYIVFNEGEKNVSTKLDIAVKGSLQLINPNTAKAVILKLNENISLKPYEIIILG